VITRADGVGAVASWSPTGLGVATGHDVLNRAFYEAVFVDGVTTIGEATQAGKLALWSTGSNQDLLDTYLLFGDPATKLPISPTAVDLLWFTATGGEEAITLGWETATELENLGFNLYRAESVDGPRTKLNEVMIPTNVPPGSNEGAVYEYVDGDVVPGITYYYWLEDVDIYGGTGLHGPVDAQATGPAMYVGSIDLRYRARGPRWNVVANTSVLGGAADPVVGAMISVRWTLPDGSTLDQLVESSKKGMAAFKITGAQDGEYGFCVTDVTKEGWVYDAEQNVETCDTISVP
jgi:hypothetical protein